MEGGTTEGGAAEGKAAEDKAAEDKAAEDKAAEGKAAEDSAAEDSAAKTGKVKGGAVEPGAVDGSTVEPGAVDGSAAEPGAVAGGAVAGGAVAGGAVAGGASPASSPRIPARDAGAGPASEDGRRSALKTCVITKPFAARWVERSRSEAVVKRPGRRSAEGKRRGSRGSGRPPKRTREKERIRVSGRKVVVTQAANRGSGKGGW
jgi:hypothetical protein